MKKFVNEVFGDEMYSAKETIGNVPVYVLGMDAVIDYNNTIRDEADIDATMDDWDTEEVIAWAEFDHDAPKPPRFVITNSGDWLNGYKRIEDGPEYELVDSARTTSYSAEELLDDIVEGGE